MKPSPSKQASSERKNSHFRLPFSRCYNVHEQEKRRTYDEQIWEVERACFFPLVFFSHRRYQSSCYDCLQETCLHVGWKMEDELQPLFIMGEVLLVLFFAE